MKKHQTFKHVNPFQKVAKRPGEAVMLKQVENIANICDISIHQTKYPKYLVN